MEPPTQTATAQLNRDLSPQWLEMIDRVRTLARRSSTDSSADVRELSRESLKLCRHVERLHANVETLLGGDTPPAPKAEQHEDDHQEALTDEEKEALKIQREIHEPSNIRQVIKALFLWQDYPEERLEDEET